MDVHLALRALERVENGMKSLEFIRSATDKKLNSSFALLAVQALQDYLRGEVASAQEDFATLAAELSARALPAARAKE